MWHRLAVVELKHPPLAHFAFYSCQLSRTETTLSFITSDEVQTFKQVRRVYWKLEETSSESWVKQFMALRTKCAADGLNATHMRAGKGKQKITASSPIWYSIFTHLLSTSKSTPIYYFMCTEEGEIGPKDDCVQAQNNKTTTPACICAFCEI